jgi:hypothetical protein
MSLPLHPRAAGRGETDTFVHAEMRGNRMELTEQQFVKVGSQDRFVKTTGLTHSNLCVGEWVEVRPKDEILATLDSEGQLDGMPFMPEMFEACGRRFRVFKRATKTCDTVNDYKGRKITNTVHLEGSRCDGSAHGGCEAGCLIFWKTAWLRPIASNSRAQSASDGPTARAVACTEVDVRRLTLRVDEASAADPAYVCQATQLPAFTAPLSPWELRQYAEDLKSGNVKLGRMISSFIYMAYHHGLVNLGIGWGPLLRWIYDMFQRLRGGSPYPRIHGRLPAGAKTPSVTLDLQPGEWVKVKGRDDILATCDEGDMNRGMKFDAELVPYCGGTYQVLRRVSKIVNERSGKMQYMKTPCIVLDTVVCQARYSECRLFCPRSIYLYWREIWLERTAGPDSSSVGAAR